MYMVSPTQLADSGVSYPTADKHGLISISVWVLV